MKAKQRKFRVKAAIVGGGLTLRAGEIVDESQLGRHAESLQHLGGVEEVRGPETVHMHRRSLGRAHPA